MSKTQDETYTGHEPMLVSSPVTLDGMPVSAKIKLVCTEPDCDWFADLGSKTFIGPYEDALKWYREDHDRG